jgi:hypothetical protein
MLTHKRLVTVAVTAAVAIVPALAVQSAEARIAPLEDCHLKWVLPPDTSMFAEGDDHRPSIRDFDVENQFSSGENQDPWATETVEHDDLSYDGC